jgi:thiol-disulfide isomerase/thioredoxin
MKKTLTISALFVLLATAALAQTGGVGAVRGGSRDRIPVVDAKDFDLNKLAGRVALVAFWKTPDEESARMLPWLNQLQQDLDGKGLTVVAVNVDEKAGAAVDALSLFHPRIQVVIDSRGRMPSRYGLSQVPGAVLFDRGGGRRGEMIGFPVSLTDSLTTVVTALVDEEFAPPQR